MRYTNHSLMIIARFLLPTLLIVSSISANAAKWDEMDYGRFLSATFANPQGQTTLEGKGCVANKGVAAKLGKDAQAAILFDTECVRMAGGWTGGWVKLKGVAFDGGHGPNPGPIEGANVYFQTNPGPVWSKDGTFSDPRKLPAGPGAAKVPLGPLPRDWAKYRGLYLHGDRVVFAYSVGTAELLESGDVARSGDTDVLTRTFNVVSAGAASSVILAEGQNGAVAKVDGDIATTTGDTKEPDKIVVITTQQAPAGSQLITEGARVILKLPPFAPGQAFLVAYAKGATADTAKLASAAKAASKATDLRAFTQGGPARWNQAVTTKGTLSADADKQPYVLDSIAIPFDNPWKSWIRPGGLDFFPDGRAAISTWSGDVWIVSGLDEKLENVSWKRHATGLFQALGLKIVNNQVFVLGRDQITRLRDLNNDGEADFYENFNNDVQVTPGFHEFAFDLQTDPEGSFYFSKGGPVNPGGSGWGPLSDHNGCILKISKDGQKFEVFATGVRAPNGMGVGPNGEVTTGDNQGTWVPACYLHWAKAGDFISVADLAHRPTVPSKHGAHICYLPMSMDNSGGGQIWVTSNQWGPLTGRLLHLTYGKSGLLGTMIEQVNGVPQGGAFRFPFKFDSGAMRARFNPKDGQLYVAALKGWQTDGARDGAFQRVRYTGKKVTFPEELHVTDAGIHITFSNPLEAGCIADPENYAIEQYNYRWTNAYGSGEYKVSDPKQRGREIVEIKAVRVGDDRRSVFLEVPGLQPVDQMEIKLNLKAEDGSPIVNKIANTINVVPPESAPGKAYRTLVK